MEINWKIILRKMNLWEWRPWPLLIVILLGMSSSNSTDYNEVRNSQKYGVDIFLKDLGACTYHIIHVGDHHENYDILGESKPINNLNPAIIFRLDATKRFYRRRAKFRFGVKFREGCAIQIFEYLEYSKSKVLWKQSASETLLTLEGLVNLTLVQNQLFGSPQYAIFYVRWKNAINNLKFLEVEKNESINKIDNLLRDSPKILFATRDSRKLLILCLTCIWKRNAPKLLHNPGNYTKQSVHNLWTKLNTNFYNSKKPEGELIQRLELCDRFNLSMNLPSPSVADKWDYRCTDISFRHRYNHTLSFDQFMGLWNRHAASFTETTLPQIMSTSLMSTEFIYKVVVRLNIQPSVSFQAIFQGMDTPAWVASITLFFVMAILLRWSSGGTFQILWLFAELLEKGFVISRKIRDKFPSSCYIIVVWSFGTFIFRQLYCTEMYSKLTYIPSPKVPRTLEQVAFHSPIPLLTHAYDFLQKNYSQTAQLAQGSDLNLRRYREVMYCVNDIISYIVPIVNHIPFVSQVAKPNEAFGGKQLPFFAVPSNFAIVLFKEDLTVFEVIMTALMLVFRKSIQTEDYIKFVSSNYMDVSIFFRIRMWTIPNNFMAEYVIRDVASLFQSGIYEGRLLQVKMANRIITRFRRNIGNATIDSEPRWISHILYGSMGENQGQKAFSMESLDIVWFLFGGCSLVSCVVFFAELMQLCLSRCDTQVQFIW